jgi:hypothetical protein
MKPLVEKVFNVFGGSDTANAPKKHKRCFFGGMS